MSDAQPSVLRAGFSMARTAVRVRRPRPRSGQAAPSHDGLAEALTALARRGPSAIGDIDGLLAEYMAEIAVVDPNALDADDALAHWINVYNAGALRLAARADREGSDSVLRIPGAFSSPFLTVADEPLSLDGIEHGKIRRFGDPRIHGALVCGSVSCPTLRAEPFVGPALDAQLDDQLRA
ncbi:MAG: DUF547 domain-containing protein, partial [Acidimicrobiia bacterium]|nr:DUF547 domain-containing protein [Acidimicrobiia bacterium]